MYHINFSNPQLGIKRNSATFLKPIMALESGVAVVQQLFACINNNDIPNVDHFELLLHDYLEDTSSEGAEGAGGTSGETLKGAEGLRRTLKEICLSPRQNKIDIISKHRPSNDKTLMQLISERGLDQFAIKLLEKGVDPNLSNECNVKPDNDQTLPPVLLAAKNARYKVLQAFKEHNDDINASTSMLIINESQSNGASSSCSAMAQSRTNIESIELVQQTSKTGIPCNFSVWSKETNETVLHLILKEPKLKQFKLSYASLPRTRTISRTDSQHVILRRDKSDKRRLMRKEYEKCLDVVLGTEDFIKIVLHSENQEHSIGFHEKQIRLIVNKKESCKPENTPLHYAINGKWSEGVQKRLLNLGANLLAKNAFDESPLSRVSYGTLRNFLDEYCMIPTEEDLDDYFGSNIAKSPILFRYRFLAPQVAENIDLSIRDNEDHRRKGNPIPEMEVLMAISESEDNNIRRLVQHPVMKSFTWIKWKLMCKYFNRNMRIRTLLMIFLSWYIFASYGGSQWNKNKLISSLFGNNSTTFSDFGNASYTFCNGATFSFDSLFQLGNNHYTKDWYILFATHAIIQIFFIIMDIKAEFNSHACYNSRDVNNNRSLRSVLIACLFDVITFLLILLILIGAEGVLWFVITILLALQCVKEYVQIVSSFPQYFFYLDNYFDMVQIVAICIILYYPNQIDDTTRFSVHGSSLPDEEEHELHCMVKRSLSALTILFSSVRLLISVARHPNLEQCNIYFMMFYRVTASFLKFLFWYSSFVVAFGLGFYIIFHDDVNDDKNNKMSTSQNDDREETRFDVPYVALMRTSVMFIGEIDFTELPIKGGNISKTLTYFFILCFIFLMVMVLMNLLNGMAVSDTGQILNEAVILSQIKFIETLDYFEKVLFDNYSWLHVCLSICPSLKTCTKNGIRSSGILVFHSPYIQNHGIKLPLNQKQTTLRTSVNLIESQKGLPNIQNEIAVSGVCSRLRKFFGCMNRLKKFTTNNEDQGSEGFLRAARDILIREDYHKRQEEVAGKDEPAENKSTKYRQSSLSTWERGRDKLGLRKADTMYEIPY